MREPGRTAYRWALTALTLAAFLIRVFRLEWQPLWWDEGYSVYFATEPWARMLSLTAQDIHPPLYYTLLHQWTLLLDSARPAVVRLLSVFSGVAAVPLIGALGWSMSRRISPALLAAAYLAVSPLHVFYSQEVRMYSLALALGLATTYALHHWVEGVEEARPSPVPLVAYVLLSALMLHTLYYTGFLVLAQIVYAMLRIHGRRSASLSLALAVTAILLLCLPWWLYALPKLSTYISGKVQSDQDQPLGLVTYAVRHAIAFTSGHVVPKGQPARILPFVGLLAALPALLTVQFVGKRVAPSHRAGHPLAQLWALFIVPCALAFLVNLRYPFFPEGGERLLLFVLPYFLLLAAAGVASTPALSPLWLALALPLFVTSGLGLAGYFTVPRYVDDDYRPIIAQVVHLGSERDSVLALFPWQVGYWRAYSPHDEAGALLSPQPQPVGQAALVWDKELQTRIDAALDQGVLWFPAPVSFGSTLPGQILTYLTHNAMSVEDRWHGAATHLTAWAAPVGLSPAPLAASFPSEESQLVLESTGVGGDAVTSDNEVVAVDLRWSPVSDPESWHVTIRLRDEQGRDWARRDYQRPGGLGSPLRTSADEANDLLGLIVPAGVPPGRFSVMAGAVHIGIDSSGAAIDEPQAVMAEIGRIQVEAPDAPLSIHRLSLDFVATGPRQNGPVHILGSVGPAVGEPHLSGTYVSFLLAMRSTAPVSDDYTVGVSIVDGSGTSVASWQGWTLPGYPTSTWNSGALVLTPIDMYLPATLRPGRYSITAHLLNGAGEALPEQHISDIVVDQRESHFERTEPSTLLPDPAQFGTHVLLYGYDLQTDGDSLELTLYWQVLQTLLPPHHIFIHAVGPSGDIVAQNDGAPQSPEGPAPTGSWREGEYITTLHQLTLGGGHGEPTTLEDIVLRVGLYEPQSGVRLPAFVAGHPAGDNVAIVAYP